MKKYVLIFVSVIFFSLAHHKSKIKSLSMLKMEIIKFIVTSKNTLIAVEWKALS